MQFGPGPGGFEEGDTIGARDQDHRRQGGISQGRERLRIAVVLRLQARQGAQAGDVPRRGFQKPTPGRRQFE